ncbi:hypothetical protein ACQUFY_27070 (plasmid) [Robbsia andropogonis]|uniref:hypothetical protein n=1 Tax=Robbsia andropogonis TaxID=28092 RepID=UPI003D1E5613
MRLAQKFVMCVCKNLHQRKRVLRDTAHIKLGDPYQPSSNRVIQRQFRPALAWVVISTARRNPGAIVLFVVVWSALVITELYRGASYLFEVVTK